MSQKSLKPEKLTQLMIRLWRAVQPRRRRQFIGLVFLMLLTSFTEVISIATVLPFLGALASPERVFDHAILQHLLRSAGANSPQEIVLPITIAFCAASLIAGGMSVLLIRLSLGYAFSLGADLSTEVYKRTLYQPYAVHLARNSSEIINAISIKTSEVIFYIIVPSMTLFSSVLMSVAIIITLANILTLTALSSFAAFGLLYAGLVSFLRRRLRGNSETISHKSTLAIRQLQEGLGGIRDILLDGTQEHFISTFHRNEVELRTAQRDNSFIGQSPRYVMESVGMVLIAAIAYGFTHLDTGVVGVIPMLATLALGLQRLLPAMQKIYNSLSTIHGSEQSLSETLKLLEQKLPSRQMDASEPKHCIDANTLVFERDIKLQSVSFRYAKDTPWILDGIDLTITKGSRVGFVGETGSGKSTLLDIVMGLLHPSRGELLVDGINVTKSNVAAWRPHIAHVPQDIFLTDGTLRENIAFGVPSHLIDDEAVRRAAAMAQLATTIDSWALGYETVVGERGVQLSGGQRQRIGIARALYKKADVFIFDEATSALDNVTEEAVMRSIESLDSKITVLIIAHRTSTLKNCDKIFNINCKRSNA